MSAGKFFKKWKAMLSYDSVGLASFTMSSQFRNYYLLFELSEKWSEVRLSLGVSCTGQFALHASLHVVLSAVEIFGPNAKKKLQTKES